MKIGELIFVREWLDAERNVHQIEFIFECSPYTKIEAVQSEIPDGRQIELSGNPLPNHDFSALGEIIHLKVGNFQLLILGILHLMLTREIIGHRAGAHKDAQLVHQALALVQGNLNDIQMFHTDRGNEFKNKLIDEALTAFQIKRSLSLKGCPYDNAVTEATFKIFKTEFIRNRHFESLEQLQLELDDYVHWFNQISIHGTLSYFTPVEYKSTHLKKLSSLVLTIHFILNMT